MRALERTLLEVEAERDQALEGRAQWMEKTSQARQQIGMLKDLCQRAAEAIETARQGGRLDTAFYTQLLAELHQALCE